MREEAYYNVLESGRPSYWMLTVYAENWQPVLEATLKEEDLLENVAMLQAIGAVPAAEATIRQAFGMPAALAESLE